MRDVTEKIRRPTIEERLRDLLAQYHNAGDTRKGLEGCLIIEMNPNAPLCIMCRFCQGQSRFICPIFQFPEDGKIVEKHGIVYSIRGTKPRTYPNVPMKPEECSVFEPLITEERIKWLEQTLEKMADTTSAIDKEEVRELVTWLKGSRKEWVEKS